MPTAPNTPGFGTGYVDWGNYVNANQANTQQDRSKVQNYLGGLNQQAGNTQAAAPGATSDPYGTLQEALQTGQQALQTPAGFEQVLAAANANYDPIKGAATGKGPPQAPNDPFSAALEGQNAGGLAPSSINGPAPTPTPSTIGPTKGPDTPKDYGRHNKPQNPNMPVDQGDTAPDWSQYANPRDLVGAQAGPKKLRGTP